MKHTLFSNYHWEKDENGKDNYDYARQSVWDNDEEHRFEDADYCDDIQLRIVGCEEYTCPICGEVFANLDDAKQCCRSEKWETLDDIPDAEVEGEVYIQEDLMWTDMKFNLTYFIDKSPYGFLLRGSVGRWDGVSKGGYFVDKFDDLYKCWEDCDYIKIYDENGHLYIYCSHHDGNNSYEIKALTEKGAEFRNNHGYDYNDRALHDKLWNNDLYTELPYFAHKIYGCEKES